MDGRHGHAVDASLSVAMIPLDCKSGGWQVLETVENMAQLCLGSHDLQARRGEGKRERESVRFNCFLSPSFWLLILIN